MREEVGESFEKCVWWILGELLLLCTIEEKGLFLIKHENKIVKTTFE